MRQLLADLHVHTLLSPCAEVEMIPPLIVKRAQALGLGLIAVTDHNAAGNCAAVMRAAEAAGSGLVVLPGMEVQSAEEVHLLCLFDGLEQALTWQGIVFDHLPAQSNPESVLGAQFVVNAEGEYVRTEARLLLTSTDLPLDDLIRRVAALGGLALPAHVDRPSFSLLANLGFVPPELASPALELSVRADPEAVRARWPELADWALFRSSDAHRLHEMRATLNLTVERATVMELRLAFGQRAGRAFTMIA